MSIAMAFVLALAGEGVPAALPAPGEVGDVKCRAQPQLSYALSLPPGFDPVRQWPILYVFDPRGRARLALDLFRDAAHEHGWIVASSHDTRSDADAGPSLKAIEAMWADTHERLPLMPRRAYAAGMSGGARLACQLGAAARGELVGVIAAAGSFPDPSAPPRDTPFAVFGTTGDRDFNYYEMRTLAGTLERAAVPYRLEVHEGEHGWPPAAVARDGLDWLELQTLRRNGDGGTNALQDLARRWRERQVEAARAREARGDMVGALDLWRMLLADLDGIADVTDLRAQIARLGGRRDVAAERERRQRRDNDDVRWLERSRARLARLSPPGPTPTVQGLVRDLGLDPLLQEARAEPPTYDTRSAQRRLADVLVLTSFYLPRGLLEVGQPERAAIAYGVALTIRPERFVDRYNAACAWARAGKKREALAELRRAVDDGFRDAAHIAADPDLKPLAGSPELQQILEVARTPR
jgi:predicted esterase